VLLTRRPHVFWRSKMRAILYARVSKDDTSNDGRNLEGQLDMGRQYAKEQGYSIVAELPEDVRGASGASFDLPQINRSLSMAQAGEFDVLVVREIDRLSRDLAKQLFLENEFKRHGVRIEYVLGRYDDSPEGELMKKVRAVIADYERTKITERSARGRRLKAKDGKWPGDGHAGYGYAKIGQGKKAHLVIDAVEAGIVWRIFELYVGREGKPLPFQSIAAMLTAEGVPPPNRGAAANEKYASNVWHRNTVRSIIDHSRYVGRFRYGDIGVHLPELAIIDEETWEAAKARRKQSKGRYARKGQKYEWLLAGHVQCSCGGGMSGTAMQKGRYRYYQCNQYGNKRHARTCDEKMLRAPETEEAVWEWIHNLLTDEQELEAGLAQLSELRENELADKRERLERISDLLGASGETISRLARAMRENSNPAVLKALETELGIAAREQEALVSERETLRAQVTQGRLTEADRDAIRSFASEIRRKIDNPTIEQKRQVLDILDCRVELQQREDERVLRVTCGLKLNENGERIPHWIRPSSLCGKFSFTTTTLPRMILSSPFSSGSSHSRRSSPSTSPTWRTAKASPW
jgi:site-specific DNA recombinase